MNHKPSSFPNNKPQVSLFLQLCWREITETTKGSVFGFIWLIVGPLLSMMLYVIVFGVLFGGKFREGTDESSLHFALGVYIGLTTVNMINETIARSPILIQSKSSFVKRVIFPLSLLPVVQVCGIGFKWIVNILLWFVLAAVFQTLSIYSFSSLLLLILPIVLIGMGIGWLLAALSVFFKDIQQLIPVLTQIVFWSSGVFYSTTKVMEVPVLWNILKWNPVLLTVENLRHILLWQSPVNPTQTAYIWGVSILVFIAGKAFYSRLQKGFAEFI